MLRITIDKNPQALTLRLEGRLEGPWVVVLTQCWNGALAKLSGRKLCVDLNGVTFVDSAGKARLAEIYAKGAELLGEDLETKALVAEIHTGRASGIDGDPRTVSSHKAVVNISEQLAHLQQLQGELQEVNEAFAQAARPLERLSELNGEQRQEVADQLRAKFARWESVTQQISRVLGTDSAENK